MPLNLVWQEHTTQTASNAAAVGTPHGASLGGTDTIAACAKYGRRPAQTQPRSSCGVCPALHPTARALRAPAVLACCSPHAANPGTPRHGRERSAESTRVAQTSSGTVSAQQAQRRLRAKEPARAPGKQCGLGRSSRGDCTAGSNQTEIQATMWARVACWETLRAWRSEGKGGRRQTCARRGGQWRRSNSTVCFCGFLSRKKKSLAFPHSREEWAHTLAGWGHRLTSPWRTRHATLKRGQRRRLLPPRQAREMSMRCQNRVESESAKMRAAGADVTAEAPVAHSAKLLLLKGPVCSQA